MGRKTQKNLFVLATLGPAFLCFLAFVVAPTLRIFVMSMYEVNRYNAAETKFVGLDNFITLFTGKVGNTIVQEIPMRMAAALKNTLFLIVIIGIITLFVAIIMAAILVRENIKGKNLLRIIFYIPNILSVVVIAGIFQAIYERNFGLLNSFLSFFGIGPVDWLGSGANTPVLYAIAGAMIWQAIGYYMVMYMASISSIPEHLYEASSLEGAGKIYEFFSITLPLLWNTLRTTLTFFVVSTINLSFVLVTIMASKRSDNEATVILFEMSKEQGTQGFAMAIGVVTFIFSFGISAILNAITKRDVYEF